MQASVNYSEVLDVHILRAEVAVLAVQPMLDELVLWVEVVQNDICVTAVARCEHHQLELLT
jgi:hypothetical protein